MGAGRLHRRQFLLRTAAMVAAMPLSGCQELSENRQVLQVLGAAESVTYRVQRSLMSRRALAPEYSEHDLSKLLKANGTTEPDDAAYQDLAESGFQNWRLQIGGLVERPLQLSLADLRQLPSRTQITRH